MLRFAWRSRRYIYAALIISSLLAFTELGALVEYKTGIAVKPALQKTLATAWGTGAGLVSAGTSWNWEDALLASGLVLLVGGAGWRVQGWRRLRNAEKWAGRLTDFTKARATTMRALATTVRQMPTAGRFHLPDDAQAVISAANMACSMYVDAAIARARPTPIPADFADRVITRCLAAESNLSWGSARKKIIEDVIADEVANFNRLVVRPTGATAEAIAQQQAGAQTALHRWGFIDTSPPV